jgi:serine/threonine-protein kinase HipA
LVSALNVWMNGELVGTWTITRTGTHAFNYEPGWVASANARALSLSLPITADRELRGPVVEHYFDNLLPDSVSIRERIRRRFGTRSTQAFALLGAIGRDCAGAVQILPPDTAPTGFDSIDGTPINDDAIDRLLKGLISPAVPGAPEMDDYRISIAGAQEKTALLRIGKRWHQPHKATPSTHILKLPLGLVGGRQLDMTDSVENEWLCAQIAAALGLRVAATEMAVFNEQKALVVERFDRKWIGAPRAVAGSWIARLPQEDFCQATGTEAAGKYESAGGPGIRRCLDILAGSVSPNEDRTRFLLSQLAFWLLAATDGHAKNFSLFHHRGGSFSLTPLYDVISMWPVIGKSAGQLSMQDAKLAMAVRTKNAHYRLLEIQTRHWRQLAETSGAPDAWESMQALVNRVDDALAKVEKQLPPKFPDQVWKSIAKGMRAQVKMFHAGLSDAAKAI